jgi:hypothetical protein
MLTFMGSGSSARTIIPFLIPILFTSKTYALYWTRYPLSMAVNMMDFKQATDVLFDNLSHAELAEELGVSVAKIRQARLDRSAAAHRPPPKGWRAAVIKLAERRITHYRELIDKLYV